MLNADYLKAVKKYMEVNELNQKQMAHLLQVVPNTITNWMNGGTINEKHKARIRALCSQPIQNPAYTDFSVEQQQIPVILDKQIVECKCYIDILSILDDIMGSDMCDDCKIKAYNIIKARRIQDNGGGNNGNSAEKK